VNSDQATATVIDALNALGVPYMLVGSLSSSLHGIPRSTRDADFVVRVSPGQIGNLVARLGPQFRLDPQVSFETVTGTTRYILAPVDIPYRIELFCLSDDPFDQERFARRQTCPLLGRQAFVSTPEDVIIVKLRWANELNRSKDLEDARGVIAVQADRLDWEYIDRWCRLHGTREVLERLRDTMPPP
jgi:hypothetical protein